MSREEKQMGELTMGLPPMELPPGLERGGRVLGTKDTLGAYPLGSRWENKNHSNISAKAGLPQ